MRILETGKEVWIGCSRRRIVRPFLRDCTTEDVKRCAAIHKSDLRHAGGRVHEGPKAHIGRAVRTDRRILDRCLARPEGAASAAKHRED